MLGNWLKISEVPPPEGRIVMTKVEDDRGTRNEWTLKRVGGLFFVPNGSMFVYYGPTHWRPLTDDEAAKEAADLTEERDAYTERINGILESLGRSHRR